jgi:hypothetical protein
MRVIGLEGKRKHRRVRAPEIGLVDVFRFEHTGAKRRIGPSLLEDMSPDGLAIRMDNRIPVGTELFIRNRSAGCRVIVRHCMRIDVGYRIGVELQARQKEAMTADVFHLLGPNF